MHADVRKSLLFILFLIWVYGQESFLMGVGRKGEKTNRITPFGNRELSHHRMYILSNCSAAQFFHPFFFFKF